MVNAPSSSSTAVLKTSTGDGRNRAGIAAYTAHWDKDSSKDTAADMEARKGAYTDVVNGYYDGACLLHHDTVHVPLDTWRQS